MLAKFRKNGYGLTMTSNPTNKVASYLIWYFYTSINFDTELGIIYLVRAQNFPKN